jgi:hypothetical protein
MRSYDFCYPSFSYFSINTVPNKGVLEEEAFLHQVKNLEDFDPAYIFALLLRVTR